MDDSNYQVPEGKLATPLASGHWSLWEKVFLQIQQGASSIKWDRSGIAVESLGNNQYWVMTAHRAPAHSTILTPPYHRAAAIPAPSQLAESSSHPSMLPPHSQEKSIPSPLVAAPGGLSTDNPLPPIEGPTLAYNTPSENEPSAVPTPSAVLTLTPPHFRCRYHSHHCHLHACAMNVSCRNALDLRQGYG